MALAGSNRKPALTAAASKISYSRATTQKLKEEPWQVRAWQVYEAEGSIYFMTRYRSAVARKIDYYAARILEPGDDPDIDATVDADGEFTGPGEASKVLDTEGGPELLRRLVSELMVHWDVPGEAYLTRFNEAPFWRVLSTQELKKQGDGYVWMDDDFEKGTVDSDAVYRVWKPHPRFHWQADSPTKHVLEDAEELILLRRELKARSQSRLPAGAWILPDTVDFTPFGQDEAGTEDDFARELTSQMTQAVSDPGSAAAQVPWVLTVSPSDHPLVVGGFINFHRDWEVPMEQREALLRAIATGLDVPPEILTGMADLNHWSAWLVSEQAVSQHVAPTVDDILDSLTINWFRPLLAAASVDPDRYVLWRDLSPATVPPDRTDTALAMFKEGVISDIAVRRVSDFDEEDAPEQVEGETPPMEADELLKRINAFGTLRRAGAEWEDAVKAVGLPPITQIPGLLPITVRAEGVVQNEEAVVSGVQAAVDEPIVVTQSWLDAWLVDTLKSLKEGGPPLAEAAVTAATRRRVDAKPLADIDRELLAWLVDETQTEIDRLLDVVEKSLTAASDPLDETLLARFRSRVEKKITEAQTAARQWVERLTGRVTEFADEAQTRSIGLDLIVGGVLEAIRRRLFTPGARPDPIDTGRLPDTLPPTDILRRGLTVAGGGKARFEDAATVDMIGNGQRIHDELEANGFHPELFRWVYGHPKNPFEPHRRLSGVEFDSWESPKLAVSVDGSWVGGSHFRPGDHRGCQCSVEQVIAGPLRDVGEVPGAPQQTVGGSGNISTDGMSAEEAADYIATKNELTARYPKQAASVRHWGTGEDAGSRDALHRSIVRDRATYEVTWTERGVSAEGLAAKAAMNRADEALALLDQGNFNKAFEMRYGDSNFNGLFLDDTIIVRPGVGRGTAPFKVGVPEDWSGTKYTATHEFGHAVEHDFLTRLHDRTPLASSVEAAKGYNTFQDAVVRTGNNGKTVSNYGATNPAEGFAESFTAHEAGVQSGSTARLLAIAEDAESWPSFGDVRDTGVMRPIEWIQALDELGEAPWFGVFRP